MAIIGRTYYTVSTVQNIDQWKRFREANGGGYIECTEDPVDYTCPWIKVDDERVYSFNAPAEIEDDLSTDDVITYQWRPAGYDEDIANAEDFYITSIAYIIMNVNVSTGKRLAFSVGSFGF
jgi:hypothetical protein